ncbi:MAG TPA: radical SAM protein [Bacteroidota bacterium]|nr:radical SAM protein [Bacteroidota bacterium]
MSKILLTHSYFLRFDPKEFRLMMPYPPLGTLYGASYVRGLGHDVVLHDTMFSSREDEIEETLRRYRPEIVVIYDDCFNYLTKMCLTRMREAAFEISRLARHYSAKVVVFGSDAADHAEDYLDHGADFVIVGEGEQTLGELVQFLAGKTAQVFPDAIDGLVYRNRGTLVKTRARRVVQDLDTFPFPAWDLVDFDRYRRLWKERHGYFSLNLVTTRGCPFHCNWCAKPIYGQVYHSRSPENVVDEMELLKRLANPDHVWFADDIFGLRPGWISRFDEAINASGTRIPFKCLSRVDLLLEEDNIRHLRNAGCRTVWVGAESGSQSILDAMEKGTTVEQIHRATSLLREAGINVGFFLQFGYPGETKDDIDMTLAMVRECMPDEIGVSVSYPLPGTKFYDRVKGELAAKQNWIVSEDLDMMFAGTYVPDFYRELHRVVHKKFSIWRGVRAIRTIATTPYTLTLRSLHQIAAMFFHLITLPASLRRLTALEGIRR